MIVLVVLVWLGLGVVGVGFAHARHLTKDLEEEYRFSADWWDTWFNVIWGPLCIFAMLGVYGSKNGWRLK